MMLDFRQRLLATTLLVGASALATPAFAQADAPRPECPPGTPPGTAGCNPPDTATGSAPETTTPQEGQTTVPSTSATGEPVSRTQDIVITGTRIPQPNLTSASPVTVLSSQEVKLQGTSRTEDLVNSLPQSFAAQGSNVSNGASGTATVNLRNLGSNRTLVLVNGRRMQPGSIFTVAPDINNIPTQLIKRVDVLTGGASSVYGADAVGGVVNFIMDNTFTGVRLDAQASFFMHDNDTNDDILDANAAAPGGTPFRPPSGLSINGGARDIGAVLGAAFDDGRGHAQGYLTYRRQDAVLQSSRDYSFCALNGLSQTSVNTLGRRFSCAGSGTSATGTFLAFTPSFGGAITRQIGGAGGNLFVPGTTPFNFNPYNYFQRPDERYTLGAFADYEIAPGAKPYIEAMFMDDQSVAQIAPSGNFGNTAVLNCDNPLLPANASAPGQPCDPARAATTLPAIGITSPIINPVTGLPSQLALVYTLRRNVEGGGRRDDLQHTAYRLVAGLRGDPIPGISYDAYYQYGRTLRNETYENDFSITRLGRALDVVDADPGPGIDPVCRSVLTGVDPNCVPYNIFTAGGVTPEALQYLQVPGLSRGKVDQRIAHVDVTLSGEEYGLKAPWATNGVGINVGAEYRKERMQFRVDEAFRLGDLAGQGGPTPPVSGQFDVRELFAEAQIPIVENNFIDLLQLSAGYRYSNYKVGDGGFNTDTYKLAAEFAPIRDIRFRGAYNRAVRAPNIVELFFPQSLGLAGQNDPCAGDFDPTTTDPAPTATLAQCQLTGVTAAQYGSIVPNPAAQYNALFGGNPDLQPEKADTYTAGVILQPRFIPGLALTADYFNIKVKNLIGISTFASVFEECFGGDASQCALIQRAPGSGSLWLGAQGFVVLTNQNFAGTGLTTKGWDFSGSYSRRMGGMGTLNASFVGTRLGESNTIGGVPVGGYAGNIPVPKWRHKARLGFNLPNGVGISGQWRYFSAVRCDPETDPNGGCGTAANPIPGNLKLNAMNYFDLALTARITQKFNLRMGANNIFDSEPPVAGQQTVGPPFGNGNTFPQIYDALGRYMFAGVTVDF